MSDDLEGLTKELLEFAQTEYPKETKKFLQSEGNKFKKLVKKRAKSEVGTETGNYQKGWKRGRVYNHRATGATSVRVYNGSPHAHLIEYGHKKYLWGKETSERVEGKHVLEKAGEQFAPEFERNVSQFVDELLDKGLKL